MSESKDLVKVEPWKPILKRCEQYAWFGAFLAVLIYSCMVATVPWLLFVQCAFCTIGMAESVAEVIKLRPKS